MGIVLKKATFSADIKERRDFSCVVFDRLGRLLAQTAHIPVHLGAMPLTVAAIRERFSLRPGDVVLTNDPFLGGGTHLPDLTFMSGVFPDGFDPDEGPFFYLVCRAHHADVGGVTPGSMPLATSLKEEGVLLPPALLVNGGRVEEGLLRDFLARVRHPAEREGDLRAQIAPLDRGRERILDLLTQQGVEAFYARLEPLLDYGERVMRSVITSLPDGAYRFEDALDDAGLGGPPVPIRVTLRIHGSEAKVDFRESADEVATGLNTVRSVACSATYYVFFCLVGEDYPVNAGCLRPLTVLTRPGNLLDAHRPAPVAAGNVETSQRVVDCLFGTLAQAAPDQIPAASSGSMNNVAVGSRDQEATSAYVYYETIGGGIGGRPSAPGLSGVQTHITNTMNTPIEALEHAYPFLVERYTLRRGSGGRGLFRGGDGIIRRYRLLAPATVTLLTERCRLGPYGLQGGQAGKRGMNLLWRRGAAWPTILPGKGHLDVQPRDVLEIRTPGGGGWGKRDGE